MIDSRNSIARDVAIPLDAQIGAFVVIESGVTIGAGAEVGPFVYVAAGIIIGAGAHIHPHALIYADVPPGGEVGPAEVWTGVLETAIAQFAGTPPSVQVKRGRR